MVCIKNDIIPNLLPSKLNVKKSYAVAIDSIKPTSISGCSKVSYSVESFCNQDQPLKAAPKMANGNYQIAIGNSDH